MNRRFKKFRALSPSDIDKQVNEWIQKEDNISSIKNWHYQCIPRKDSEFTEEIMIVEYELKFSESEHVKE